jgi:calcineurin-like phosphoesterase family protein
MKTFFTSDTLFGRNFIAIERGFETEEEMTDTYIENWNEKISKDDIIYHLGNFSWDPITCESVMSVLNGKIHFMTGSYDSHLPQMSLIKLNKHTIIQNQISFIHNKKAIISHWPLLDWPGKEEGVIQVHGGNFETEAKHKSFRFNANIDSWNNGPIELDFLLDIVKSYNS